MIEVSREKSVGVVAIERPDKANSLPAMAKEEIAKQIRKMSHTDDLSAIVIRGTRNVFCAGSDIAEMSEFDPLQMRDMLKKESAMYQAILEARTPVVAAVNGPALGAGLILTMCCDLTIASPKATFGAPELQIGVAAPLEGLLLPWIVGLGHARNIFFRGQPLDASTAQLLGLAHEITEDEDAFPRAVDCAREVGNLPGEGFQLQKEFMRRLVQQSGLELTSALSLHATSLQFADKKNQQAMKSFLARPRDQR